MKFSLIIRGVLAASLLMSQFAFAEVSAAKIQTLLAKPKVLCGRFDQTKQLGGIKKPLASNGRFCVAQGKGILWRTLQPFPNALRLTRDEIVQMQGDRVAMRLDARQEPTVRMINGLLFSLIAGDLTQLETLFEVDGNIHGKTWSVSLKPREQGLGKVIAGIALEGGEHVKSVIINEANGDRTNIVFSGMQTGEAAITAEEAALF